MWQARSTPELRFVHLNTSILPAEDACGLSMGQTLWGDPSPHTAGVAWDWVQVQKGVVAMADPMGVITNLRLVGKAGETLSPTQAALYLNELVRTLPWQSEVQRALRSNDPGPIDSQPIHH